VQASDVRALVMTRRRHRRRAATELHDALAQLKQEHRQLILRGLRVRERVLRRLLADAQPLVRAVATQLAGYLGDRRWVPRLVAMIDEDRDPFVRVRAVEALGNLGAVEAIPLLARVAADGVHPGCYHAVSALGQLLPESARHLCAIAMEHRERGLRRQASEAIARCADGGLWTDFVQAACSAVDAGVRTTFVEGLGRSRAPRALEPVLRALSGDPAPEVRVAAADALIALSGGREVIEALTVCSLTDPFGTRTAGAPPGAREYPVREAAADALVALGCGDHHSVVTVRSARSGPMARILMIDDDSDFVAGMRILLESRGYDFFAASNGQDGLARVKEVNPDLVLLDVMMETRTEGFHVSLRLRDRSPYSEFAAWRDVPILMLTSIHQTTRLRFEPNEDYLPVDRLLEKSVRLDVILVTIEELLKSATRPECA
jgi:CheY-like chemotaxis protein